MVQSSDIAVKIKLDIIVREAANRRLNIPVQDIIHRGF